LRARRPDSAGRNGGVNALPVVVILNDVEMGVRLASIGDAPRFAAVAASAVGATCAQSEVQFNWTPVGTAGADDSFTVDDVQIEIVSSASSAASPICVFDISALA